MKKSGNEMNMFLCNWRKKVKQHHEKCAAGLYTLGNKENAEKGTKTDNANE